MPPTDHPSTVPLPARPYQGHRAGIVTRTLCASVDLLVVVIIVAGIYGGIAGISFVLDPRSFQWPDHIGLSMVAIGYVVSVIYLTLAWGTTGRSYGASLLGLRVVNFQGELMRFPIAALRAVFCVSFPIGLFWAAVSRSNRSVQDVVLRTSAIYDWRQKPQRAILPEVSPETAAPSA
ncbi:RDD family protein [Jatrophihabitans sp. GAS493]|uniref:RDD family protein n=1 Tax=Jatrophihabitans sp. GAS493 TaxID=1907575 RepID=UPI000BC06A2C|nr:RDD family protein [Jatrophihabitans sp. GAS493]SOD74816.1 RDD family protein [Jatrophihabitans sp. GAS493]